MGFHLSFIVFSTSLSTISESSIYHTYPRFGRNPIAITVFPYYQGLYIDISTTTVLLEVLHCLFICYGYQREIGLWGPGRVTRVSVNEINESGMVLHNDDGELAVRVCKSERNGKGFFGRPQKEKTNVTVKMLLVQVRFCLLTSSMVSSRPATPMLLGSSVQRMYKCQIIIKEKKGRGNNLWGYK